MKKRGLTLIEIMVVIGIIVSVALVSVPYFRDYQSHTKLKTDARALIGDLRLAQQYTVSEQNTHLIKLIVTNPQKYQLIKRIGQNDTLIKEKNLSQGISWQNTGEFSNYEIIFTSTGAVVQAGNVVLGDDLNQTSTVEVKPSGYVRLN
jgi:prepilin-type N-terminal cleavage/methylation domain-containing protein